METNNNIQDFYQSGLADFNSDLITDSKREMMWDNISSSISAPPDSPTPNNEGPSNGVKSSTNVFMNNKLILIASTSLLVLTAVIFFPFQKEEQAKESVSTQIILQTGQSNSVTLSAPAMETEKAEEIIVAEPEQPSNEATTTINTATTEPAEQISNNTAHSNLLHSSTEETGASTITINKADKSSEIIDDIPEPAPDLTPVIQREVYRDTIIQEEIRVRRKIKKRK